MVQHKAPHRCWMPAPRHLNLYDDIEVPEPATLFDDYKDNAPAARYQELEHEHGQKRRTNLGGFGTFPRRRV